MNPNTPPSFLKLFAPGKGKYVTFVKRDGKWYEPKKKRPIPQCKLLERLEREYNSQQSH